MKFLGLFLSLNAENLKPNSCHACTQSNEPKNQSMHTVQIFPLNELFCLGNEQNRTILLVATVFSIVEQNYKR